MMVFCPALWTNFKWRTQVCNVLVWWGCIASGLAGDLNAVATVVTMFFLTTYGMVNIVAGLEGLVETPLIDPYASTLGTVFRCCMAVCCHDAD